MAAAKSSTKTTKKAAPKPAGPVAIPPAPAPTAASLVPAGAEAAYLQYAPIALKASAGKTPRTYTNDAMLAYQNIATGIDALAPYADALKLLPAPFDPAALAALAAIAQATVYAAAKVDHSSPGLVRALKETARGLREVMLASAVSLAKKDKLDAREVARIKKGSGPIDLAQDCVDLAALFTASAADIAGMSPITQKDIDDARDVGNRLLQVLKPSNAPRKPLRETNPDVATRDALAAYLVEQHDLHMRRPAYWIWGDDFDDHVPPLHSHERAPQKKEPAKADGAKTNGAAVPAASDDEELPATD
jgi:hypothetical protein